MSRGGGGLYYGHKLFRQGGRHKGSRTHAALKVAFGQQLSIGIEDRKARHLQLGREDSAGWYLLAWVQIASQNCAAIRIVDLLVQWSAGIAIDDDGPCCASPL